MCSRALTSKLNLVTVSVRYWKHPVSQGGGGTAMGRLEAASLLFSGFMDWNGSLGFAQLVRSGISLPPSSCC